MLAVDASNRRGALVLSLLCGAVLALAVVLLVQDPVRAKEVSECVNKQGPPAAGGPESGHETLWLRSQEVGSSGVVDG
jgi:hypothetical protein